MMPVARIYEKELLDEGSTDTAQVNRMRKKIWDQMEASYGSSKEVVYKQEEWMCEEWDKIKQFDQSEGKLSGLPLAKIREVGLAVT